jgi:hypothetical protein
LTDLLPAIEQRLNLLTRSLELARKFGTGQIIFVVYQAEINRADFEQQLIARLAATGQGVRREQFWPDDPPDKADLLARLRQQPPADDEVVLVYDLRHAFGAGLLNSLNYRREYIPEGHWRLLFWALEDEIVRVMRDAPDF